jgi:hypothetical protein
MPALSPYQRAVVDLAPVPSIARQGSNYPDIVDVPAIQRGAKLLEVGQRCALEAEHTLPVLRDQRRATTAGKWAEGSFDLEGIHRAVGILDAGTTTTQKPQAVLCVQVSCIPGPMPGRVADPEFAGRIVPGIEVIPQNVFTADHDFARPIRGQTEPVKFLRRKRARSEAGAVRNDPSVQAVAGPPGEQSCAGGHGLVIPRGDFRMMEESDRFGLRATIECRDLGGGGGGLEGLQELRKHRPTTGVNLLYAGKRL